MLYTCGKIVFYSKLTQNSIFVIILFIEMFFVGMYVLFRNNLLFNTQCIYIYICILVLVYERNTFARSF